MLFPMLCIGQNSVHKFYTYSTNGVRDTIDVDIYKTTFTHKDPRTNYFTINIGNLNQPNSEMRFYFASHHSQFDVYEWDISSDITMTLYMKGKEVSMFQLRILPDLGKNIEYEQYYRIF